MRKFNAFLSQTGGPARIGRTLLLAILVAAAGLCGIGAERAWAKSAVTDARLGIEAERTRVVLDLTAATGYSLFVLGDPHRVVIDLDEVDWQIPAGRVLQGRGLVNAMRYGLFKVGTSRIVLDLSAPARVAHVVQLPAAEGHPPRLMIDLVAAADGDFRRQIGRTLFASDGTASPILVAAAEVVPAIAPAIVPTAPEPVAKPVLASVGSASGSASGSVVDPATNSQPASREMPKVTLPATGSLDQAAAIILPMPKPGGGGAPGGEGVKKKPLIVIDPGHGGIDPGALGNGTKEKTITLAVAKALQKELEATGRFRAVLTRDKDVFLPLRDRFRVARENGAELFISLHADSHANAKTRGASVYTLSEKASDAEAAALAAKENKSDVIAGVDLTHESKVVSGILIDLAQRETINLSARFAKILVGALKNDTLMLGNSHRFAGFAVLKAPDVPSVLLEMGYISSDEDQQLLTSKKHQKKLAKAITKAISSFFDWHDSVRGS
ncbi:N-acetylmuramoyl-L-alanine amidase [Dongia sp.]|uniref:N-acetylmuramoyl-L-alanine amidase n=1 Tax=Dongia sp. TaxID=1977262 RepID=UPI0035AE20E8